MLPRPTSHPLECAMKQVAELIRLLAVDEHGSTMVEYSIILVLIAAVCVAIVSAIGSHVEAGFANASAGL